LRGFGARLLLVTGDAGPAAARVCAQLPGLPDAAKTVLARYEGLMWSDLAAERGAEIGAAMAGFLAGCEAAHPLPPSGLAAGEGEIAGITYRIAGAGPPLLLLPLELAPSQWDPLVAALAAQFCTVALGGTELGSVASLEERGRSAYIGVVRALLRALAISPGERVLEIGCGSGVIMRELARRTAGANPLIGLDMNPYLLREAAAAAAREGLGAAVEFRAGDATRLPFEDASVDVALASTVAEEGDADRMLSELVRVTRPGGRVGVVVRAVDMPAWVNAPLSPATKAKAEAPGLIGAGVSPQGCADASLYTRLHRLGLSALDLFPQIIAVKPWQPRILRYQQQVLSVLSVAEAEEWRNAVAAAEAEGTFFITQAFHCAVGTKPA
jgi:SAM-dependent methyltransferase